MVKIKNNKIDKDKIFISINKHLYQGEKRNICLNQILNEFTLQKKKEDNCKKKKSNYNNLNTKDIEFPSLKNGSPSRFINSNGKNKKFEKISTKNFLKMMLMLNQYLINNNLIDDYANPENKKILDEYSDFLNKNIKKNNHKKKENDIDYDKKPSKKKRAVTAKEIKYEEMHKDVKKMKRDIGYITPSTDLFIGTTSNFQFITNLSEQLNKLNSSIAYQHRYYLGKRYGFDAKKDLLKINFDDNEYPANLKKSNDHHEN